MIAAQAVTDWQELCLLLLELLAIECPDVLAEIGLTKGKA